MKYVSILLFTLFMTACSTGEQGPYLSVDEYIQQNNLQTKELAQGVHAVIKNPGNSNRPSVSDEVKVNYEGFLTDGQEFDSGEEIEFNLSGLILGWQIGIPEIGEGGDITLIVPSSAGYGVRGNTSVPPNATLVFNIQLIEIIE